MSATLGLLIPLLLALGTRSPGERSDQDVPVPQDVSAADEELVSSLEPSERPCAVWRAGLDAGRLVVLAAFCSDFDSVRASSPTRWTLYVASDGSPRTRLARVALGVDDVTGCGIRGSLRVREDVLPDERVIDIGWGCRSEGDGVYPSVELWRWSAQGLQRLFVMPSSSGADPDGPSWGVWWRPAPTNGGSPQLEVVWRYSFSVGGEPVSGGEQRVDYRFNGSTFRPPPGTLLQASSWASSWLPRARVADYAPARAFDEHRATAWCAGAKRGLSLSGALAEPTRLTALEILPGYAKSEGVFGDNARVSRVRVDAFLEGGKKVSREASVADRMTLQRIAIPSRAEPIARIQVTVLDIRRGRKSQDVCISDLRVVPAEEPHP